MILQLGCSQGCREGDKAAQFPIVELSRELLERDGCCSYLQSLVQGMIAF